MAKDSHGREVVARGEWYQISYAIRRDGSSPARDSMGLLKSGRWKRALDKGLQRDEQVDAYAQMLRRMQYFADFGEGPEPESLNFLEDGIFEFKGRRARMCFYDTPGDGSHTEKSKYIYPDDSPEPFSPTWFIPDLDEELRLCNGWPKTSRLAPRSELGVARIIRTEDLEHDKRPRNDRS